jgi:hypothetical protein
MATSLTLWIDSANNKLMADWNSFVSAAKPLFIQGVEYEVTIRPLWRPKMSSALMIEDPIGSASVSFEIANRGAKPNGGFWYIQFDGENTELLEHNVSAEDLENRLNSVGSIVSRGGVRVQQVFGDGYKIVFAAEGPQTGLVGFGDGLSPVSIVDVTEVSEGSPEGKAAYWVQLRQSPVSKVIGDWVDEPQVVALAEEVADGIWGIALSGKPKDGYFSVSLNDEEPFNVSVFSSPDAIEAALGSGYSVEKSGDFGWRISKDDGGEFELEITSSSNIVSYNGKVANVKIDYGMVAEALSGQNEMTMTLQVAVTKDGSESNLLQVPCTVSGKVIS